MLAILAGFLSSS